MRVITEKQLLKSIFSAIQSIRLHYGDYDQWCISGRDVEIAIRNIFDEEGVFKPTIDIDEVKLAQINHNSLCETETYKVGGAE